MAIEPIDPTKPAEVMVEVPQQWGGVVRIATVRFDPEFGWRNPTSNCGNLSIKTMDSRPGDEFGCVGNIHIST
jgi:hypothetical protein